jgi:rRNA-processing protein FCF1
MKKIIIDTNAWMAIYDFKLDLFSVLREYCDFKYEIIILQGILDELKEISIEQRGRFKQAALLASGMIKGKKLKVVSTTGGVDDLLVEYSKKNYLILTQDVALKKRLQKPYLTIRQKKKIILVN